MGIAVAGLVDAVYLSISHYRVYTDMTYRSFCAVTKSINCDTVSQSPYAIMLGLPLPVWGVIGYAFVIILIGLGRSKNANNKHMWPTIFSCLGSLQSSQPGSGLYFQLHHSKLLPHVYSQLLRQFSADVLQLVDSQTFWQGRYLRRVQE